MSKVDMNVTVRHNVDDQHLKLDPFDFTDCENITDLKYALIEWAEEQTCLDTRIDRNDLDDFWTEVQKLRKEL